MMLTDEQIRVPLVVHWPARFAPATVIRLARHVDLLPTIADLVGRPLAGDSFHLAGRSLVPLLADPEAPPVVRYTYAQRQGFDHRAEKGDWRPGEMIALRSETHEYVYAAESEDELYDLATDPLEHDNRLGRGDPIESAMRAFLLRRYETLGRDGAAVEETVVDDRHVEELRALGYL